MKIDVSPGELLDRLTILEIKLERIAAPEKRPGLERDYLALAALRAELPGHQIDSLVEELKGVNSALWQIENELRDHERRRDFGPAFVELARSVYINNDRRTAIKRRINERLGSAMVEEKSYPSYKETP